MTRRTQTRGSEQGLQRALRRARCVCCRWGSSGRGASRGVSSGGCTTSTSRTRSAPWPTSSPSPSARRPVSSRPSVAGVSLVAGGLSLVIVVGHALDCCVRARASMLRDPLASLLSALHP
eukprot:3064091-Rhodomonas_salina.1